VLVLGGPGGKAAIVPGAYSLLADSFPPDLTRYGDQRLFKGIYLGARSGVPARRPWFVTFASAQGDVLLAIVSRMGAPLAVDLPDSRRGISI